MAPTILQWNCKGFYRRLEDVKYIISKIDPIAICIQETKFPILHVPNLNNWKIFFKNHDDGLIASGGVAILIPNQMYAEEINLNSQFQAIAIKIKFPIDICVCNVYIPPNGAFTLSMFLNLIQQLPKPFVLLGDFNAHHILWGSSAISQRGRLIADAMVCPNTDLVCLNTGKNTYFNISNGTMSAIDLTLSSSGISTKIEWSVLDDLCGSDHFPVLLTFPDIVCARTKRPRWILNKADWASYRDLALPPDVQFESIDLLVENFSKNIIESARSTIPMSSESITKRKVPWWNSDIANAIKHRKTALRRFKRSPTIDNLIEFKRLRARTVHLIKKSKLKSWHDFVSTLNIQTSYQDAWRKVQSISGNKKSNTIQNLIVNNTSYTSSEQIANILGQTFEQMSNTSNYDPSFQTYKISEEATGLQEADVNDNKDYNTNIS